MFDAGYLLRDQTNFQARFAEEYRKADDFEKVGLLRKKNERQNAVAMRLKMISTAFCLSFFFLSLVTQKIRHRTALPTQTS